jgi:hypothetical protein
MRTYVTFRHPAPFVVVSEDDGILSVDGADWFVALLNRIASLNLQSELCQEDWGVVAFAERAGKRFWIGLSMYGEGEWVAHVHHASLALFQRLSASGNRELQRVLCDLHDVLAADPAVSQIAWYREVEMRKAVPRGSSTP